MLRIVLSLLITLSLSEIAHAKQVRFALKGIAKDSFDWMLAKKLTVKEFPWSGETTGCHSTPRSALYEGDEVYWKGLHFGGWGDWEQVWVVTPCDADVNQASMSEWKAAVSALEEFYNGNDQYRKVGKKRISPLPSDEEQFGILRVYTDAWREGFIWEQNKLYSKIHRELRTRVKEKALSHVSGVKRELVFKNQNIGTLEGLIKEFDEKRSGLNDKAALILSDYKSYQNSLDLKKALINEIISRINDAKSSDSFDAVDFVVKEKWQLLELIHEERELSADLAHRALSVSHELQALDSYYEVKFAANSEIFENLSIDRASLNSSELVSSLKSIDEYANKRFQKLQSKVELLFEKIDQIAKKLINKIALVQSRKASANAMILISSTEFSRTIRLKTEALNETPKRSILKNGDIRIPLIYLGEHHTKMQNILNLDMGCKNPLGFMNQGCNNLFMAKTQAKTFIGRIPSIIHYGLLMVSIYGHNIDKSLSNKAKGFLQVGNIEDAIRAYDHLLAQNDGGSE